MSKTIQEGFTVNLQVANIGSIKPVASGTFKNDKGELIKYKASIQFRCTNIDEIEDEDLGIKEVETHLEIKIPCEETKHVKQLNEFLRKYKDSGEVFPLKTTLPRQADSNIFKVTSLLNSLEFIHEMQNPQGFPKASKPPKDEQKK